MRRNGEKENEDKGKRGEGEIGKMRRGGERENEERGERENEKGREGK